MGGLQIKNYGERESERQLFLTETESRNHGAAQLPRLFPAAVGLPGAKAGSDRNIVNQMRRSRDGSQPHQGWHDSHASC